MTTKIPAELSSTPSIVDNGNSTAVTIDSSERVGILQGSPTSNLHIGASGNDAKRELRIDGTNGSGQTFGFITEADGENGRVSFKVGQSNATPAQKLMIHPDGGICFGSDTAAANALDDYEEGTWTPATNGTGVGIAIYTATYTKIGDLVMYRCYIQIGVNTAGDAATISGLPFTNGGSNFWCAGSIWENNAKQPYVLVADGGSDTIQLRQNSSSASHPYSDFSNTHIIITGTYKTLQ